MAMKIADNVNTMMGPSYFYYTKARVYAGLFDVLKT